MLHCEVSNKNKTFSGVEYVPQTPPPPLPYNLVASTQQKSPETQMQELHWLVTGYIHIQCLSTNTQYKISSQIFNIVETCFQYLSQ